MQWIQQEPPKFLVTTDKSTKAYVLWQRNRRYVLFAHETHEQSPYDVISEICWEFVTTQWPVLALVTARPLKAHYTHSHTHTRLTALCPGLPGWANTRKAKPIWILLKQETVSGSGISWAICKAAPRSRQITTPAPHRSVFLQAGCPSCHPTNSVKALKAPTHSWDISENVMQCQGIN